MPTPDHDLRFLRVGIPQLEDYLLSEDIYQPIGISTLIGETPFPQLTLGNLMLAWTRSRASIINQAQMTEWNRLSQELEASRSKWRVAWEKKSQAEFRSRLRLWGEFLQEYGKDPEANFDRYRYEVGRRVLLQILSTEVNDLQVTDQDMLSDLDRFLNSVFEPGEFIWDAKLASSFPQTPYWYLYGRLKRNFEE
jgi:hypothetical protein